MSNSSNSSALMPMPETYIQAYKGWTVISIATSFMVLEIAVVTLRFVSRWIGKIKLAADDYLILPALACCIAINGVAIAMVQYAGVGYHFEVVLSEDPTKVILWAKFLIVESCLYLVAVILPKLAILVIYWRVFPTKPVRTICSILAAFMIIGSIIGLILAGTSCIPINAFWDLSIQNGHCLDIHALFSWASFPNILSDLAILILPLPLIWQLRIAAQVKLGLTITFLTGSIGLASSILRFDSFLQIDPRTDGTWSSVPLLTWTIVEPGIYLVAACLPTLRPLVVMFWKSSRTTPPRSAKRESGIRVDGDAAGGARVAGSAGGAGGAGDARTASARGRDDQSRDSGSTAIKHLDLYFELAEVDAASLKCGENVSEDGSEVGLQSGEKRIETGGAV